MSHRWTLKFFLIGLLSLCLSPLLQGQITANFSANVTQGCTPLLIQFTDLSTSTASGIASWKWTFGDNTSTNIKNPAKVYNTAGLFDIGLIVTDSLGNSDTLVLTNYINISSSPTANFTGLPTVGCKPVSVQFTDLSTAGSDPITSWQWSFGTGASSNAQNPPSFTYNNPNNYTVSLTVSDANGCSNQKVRTNYISVADIPTANFTSTNTQFCTFPATANFVSTSTTPSGSSNATYKWLFGDGGTTTVKNPSHTYNAPGLYDVTLIVTDTVAGCADTLTKNDFIEIYANSSLAFNHTPSQGCDNVTVQFTNTTNCPSSNWTWDFGDNTPVSTNENPSHTYTAPGSYDVIFSAVVDGVTLIDTCVACVVVNVKPSVDYTTTGNIATCHLPISASFAGTSNNPNVTWNWNFGDNLGTSTLQNPSYSYADGGTYPVRLTVTSPEGCTNTIVKDTVFARPIIADFYDNRVSSCIGGAVEFVDSTSSFYNISSWAWNFGDTTSTDQNPMITFTDTGSYQVTLVVSNVLGCVDSITNTIEVGDSVAIAFATNDTVVCIDGDVMFTNLTDLNIVGLVSDWTWDFGDGGSSNQFEPTHTYSDTGTFTVILTASYNNCESVVEKTDYIVVGPPIADFEADRDCAAPLQVTFIDKSIGATTYHWNFGVPSMTNDTSNLANPVFNYPQPGSYAVKLTVTNSLTGCSHELTQNLILNAAENVEVTFSETSGCSPLAISVSNTSSLATYVWEADGAMISDTSAAQPTITYSTAGVYDSIKLVVTHPTGCIEEIIFTDTIKVSTMLASMSASTTSGCIPLNVTFTDNSFSTSPIANWVWNFDDGDSSFVSNSVMHTYNSTGTKQPTLTVTDSVGCTKTASLNSAIVPTAPNVSFISDTLACTGQEIAFANLSTGIGLSHSWNFGDGTPTVTQISPNHTFQTTGSFNVCLTITDINGCSNTYCKTVVIADPVANFNANNTTANCSALSVQFNDLSQNAISWFWDFGDSTTSALQNPVKVYSTPGSYDVCLMIVSQSGCRDTICQPGFISISGPSATFSFTPDAGCPGTVVNFTALGENVTKFTWVWGDFTTTEVVGTGGSDSITVTHTYNDGGIYTPALVIEDGSGCQLTQLSTDTITIADFAVVIDKSEPTLCGNGSIQLNANIVSPSPVTALQWTYGTPSQTSNTATTTMAVSGAGVYPISLTASNAACTRTVTDSLVVYEAPTANFGVTPQQACVPQLVTLTDSSLIVNDSIVSWIWDFGNTLSDSIQNTTFQYNTAGNYAVELLVTTQNGCSDSLTKVIDIFANPIANAGTDATICAGQATTLAASGGTAYVWNNTTSLSCTNCANPVATPTQTTNYIVTITNANGCSDVDTVTVFVNPKPTANTPTLPAQVCEGTPISFLNSSNITAGTITAWNWNFGTPGANSNAQHPQYTYPAAGNYTVRMIVTSNLNCKDTITGQVVVNQSPTAVANFDTYICQGNEATLTASGGVSYQWSPSGTLDCSTCPTVVASPLVTTVYTLTATAANGCKDTDTVRVEVSPYPAPPLVVSSDTTICEGDVIQLIASGGTSALDYDWDTASPGLSCYANCNNPFASPTVTTDYVVTLTGQGGCIATDTITVTVIQPNSTIVAGEDQTICEGDSIQLTTILGSNHEWTPYEGLSCVFCPNPIASPVTTSTYAVKAEAFGCFVTDTITINVIEKSSVEAGEDVGLCLGNSIQLNAMGVGNISWSPSASLDNPTILNPVASPTVTTTYVLTVDNGTCLLRDSVKVSLISQAQLEVEDVEICEGESIALPVGGLADSYLWTPADGLSSDTIKSPIASPTATTTYTVTANLANCPSTTKTLKVKVIPAPNVTGFPVQQVFAGHTPEVQLDVEENATFTYYWSWISPQQQLLSCDNCPSPKLLSPTENAQVFVSVTNMFGCTTLDSINIEITQGCTEDDIILPNAFTPNGDGLNDILYVRGSAVDEIVTFQIFSRNGEKMFESDDKNIGWDGTFNGRELNTSIFVYFVEATCPITNTVFRKQGNVMLIRN